MIECNYADSQILKHTFVPLRFVFAQHLAAVDDPDALQLGVDFPLRGEDEESSDHIALPRARGSI